MRRLIAWDLMTLDGYFEGRAPWDLAFHETAWGEELEALALEHAAGAGALLFGRRTYEGMAAHWAKESGPIAAFMNGVEKLVVAGSELRPAWNNSRRLGGDPVEAVRSLKAQPGKDVYVYGSAELTSHLLANGLVDELRVCVAPVVLGGGNPLFKPADRALGLTLLEARPLRSGAVILRYQPRP